MRTFRYQTTIARPLTDVYRLASNIEKHPQLIPDYLSCRVLERQPDRVLYERTASIHGKLMTWQSWASFRENEGIYFVHHGGKLDGMLLNWQFKPKNLEETYMTITQTFHIRHPLPGVGLVLEKFVFGPKLSNIAQRVMNSFQRVCEASAKEAA